MLFGLLAVAPQLPGMSPRVRARLPLLQLDALGPEALDPLGANAAGIGSTLLFQDSHKAMSRTAETQRELLKANTREMGLPKRKRGAKSKSKGGGGGGFGAGAAPALSKAQQVHTQAPPTSLAAARTSDLAAARAPDLTAVCPCRRCFSSRRPWTAMASAMCLAS